MSTRGHENIARYRRMHHAYRRCVEKKTSLTAVLCNATVGAFFLASSSVVVRALTEFANRGRTQRKKYILLGIAKILDRRIVEIVRSFSRLIQKRGSGIIRGIFVTLGYIVAIK